MWIVLLLLLFITCSTTAYVQNCIDPTSCQFFPLHSCFATEEGLVCKSRGKEEKGLTMTFNKCCL